MKRMKKNTNRQRAKGGRGRSVCSACYVALTDFRNDVWRAITDGIPAVERGKELVYYKVLSGRIAAALKKVKRVPRLRLRPGS